jgi:hypothetical protein
VAIVRERFGQIEAGPDAAVVAPPTTPSPLVYFFTAVAAGVTVYLITRMIDGRKRR